MESVLQGWLIKSPPEKKSFGNLKIFGAKWRRRYFVLYAPPTVEGIPDAYTAILEYYTSKKLNNKCGSINLAECEEVMSSLDSDIYNHVFGLQTKHKNRSRMYYLVAESEAVMNKWVNTLIRVLGLSENADRMNIPPPSVIEAHLQLITSAISSGTKSLAARPSMARPRPNFATHPSSNNHLSPPQSGARTNLQVPAFSRFNISEPNLLECVEMSGSITSGGLCSSVPDLDQASSSLNPPQPPAPRPRTTAGEIQGPSDHPHGSERGAVGRKEAGHPPGVKGLPLGRKAEASCASTYDQPAQSYYSDPAERRRLEMAAARSRSLEEVVDDMGCYDQPPPKHREAPEASPRLGLSVKRSAPIGHQVTELHINAHSSELYNTPQSQQDFYNVPQSQQELYNVPPSQNNFYNVPPHQQEVYNVPPGQQEVYNVPPHQQDVYNVPQNQQDVYNVPQGGNRMTNGYMQDLYDSPGSSKLQRNEESPDLPARKQKSVITDDTYDAPQSHAPPKPSRKPVTKSPGEASKTNNAARPDTSVMQPGYDDVYDRPAAAASAQEEEKGDQQRGTRLVSKSSVTFKQNDVAVTSPPSYITRKQSGVTHSDSIRFTQRSKSFKRSLSGQRRSGLPLPIKRIVESGSSSDDISDEED